MKKYRRGFTLIELLVVIAVLGVLAGGVLVAINPLEKIAKAKDSTKKSTVSQLTNALQSYYTLTGQGTYPEASSAWIDTLVTNGDLKNVPPPAGGTPCTTNNQNGYCHKTNADQTEATVFVPIESESEKSKCPAGTAYFLWTSATNESGLYCSASGTDPTGTSGFTFGPDSTLIQGLAGWWTMNGNANDSSGNGNNGTAKNGASSNGTAYIFDGVDDYVQMPALADDPQAGDYTVTWWVYPFNFAEFAWAGVALGNSYQTGFTLALTRFLVGHNSTYSTRTYSLNWEQWQLVTVTHTQATKTFKFFKNETSLAADLTYTGTLTASDRVIKLGTYNDVGWGYNVKAYMDDVRIYNRALSANEVKNLYNAGPQ